MALTDIERKVLIGARESIRERATSFVCHAIAQAQVAGAKPEALSAAMTRLRAYILSTLDGRSTLGSWIAIRNGGRWMSDDLERKTRIAWITWMLGEEVLVTEQTAREFAKYTKKAK